MRAYHKWFVNLLVGMSIPTLSFPLIAQAASTSTPSTISTAADKPVNQHVSGIIPYAIVQRPYKAQLTVSGGTSHDQWHVSSGRVPPGLTFRQNTGLLSGTPSRTGDWSFTVSATNANGFAASSTFTVSVLPTHERVISVNGFSRPVPVVIRKDPVHKDLTTYISLMDLEGTLGAFQVDTTWTGKSLNLASVPGTFSANQSSHTQNPYPIEMDGLQIGSFPSFVKANGDTYLPLYNLMDALKHVQGLKTAWDGITWSITSGFGPHASNHADANPIWDWTGTWMDNATSVDIADVTSTSFHFNFDDGRLTGTANWSGDTATYTDKPRHFSVIFTRDSPTDLTVVVHAGWNNPYFSVTGIPEIRGVYQLEPMRAILSVSNNVATLTGRTRLPVGTTIHVQVGTIHWDVTANRSGVIQSREPLSYLDNGVQTLQAELTASGEIVGYLSMTNTVKAKIHHQSIATDITRFYTPGTPAYTLADFVASDSTVTNAETADAVRDVDPAQFSSTYFYPGKTPWYVLDGIDIYSVQNTSPSTATIGARLVISYGWNRVPNTAFMSDMTVNLTKVNGKWLVDVKDLSDSIYSQS